MEEIKLDGFYPKSLKITKVRESDKQIIIWLKSQKRSHKCQKCGEEMTSYHGTYIRTVQDLAILGKKVILKITAYEYYCQNKACPIKSFAENYEGFIGKSERITRRCEELIKAVAAETSCEGAAVICGKIGIKVSGDTIIRMVKKSVEEKPAEKCSETIGVDDFAYRKGQTYCTIICDGVTRKPIEILDGRDGKTLREWLGKNKHIKKVTRDRASAYAKAISDILPKAMQIADRFHLHQNLLCAVKEALSNIMSNEVLIPDIIPELENNSLLETTEKAILSEDKKTECTELSQAEKNRYDKIVKIQSYLSDGYAPTTIKRLFGHSWKTIRIYAKGDPYRLCRFDSSGMKRVNYDCYRNDIADYLRRNMTFKELFERIASDGYNGSYSQTAAYCNKLIAELGIEYSPRKNSAGVCVKKNQKLNAHCITKANIFQYIWSDKEIELADVVYIISKYPLVFDIIECVRDFRNIFIEKSEKLLKHFTEKYSVSSIKMIKSFAVGLINDYDAVKNAVVSDLSNGFVEGNNNKVKLIKRYMYGRAGLKLLRAKVISAR